MHDETRDKVIDYTCVSYIIHLYGIMYTFYLSAFWSETFTYIFLFIKLI